MNNIKLYKYCGMLHYKQIGVLVVFLYFILNNVAAQQNPAFNAKAIDSLKLQAKRMAKAFLTLDTATFIAYTDKIIIDSFFNGEKNVGNAFKTGQQDAEAMGFKNLSMEIGEVSKIAVVKNQLYALVKTHSTALIKEDTIKGESFYLAISNNGGLKWHFIDGSFIAVAGINKLFPNYDGQIGIPEITEPVFIKKDT